ncbi:hypothetical protein PABG_11300 [Paracoccidioides brasiliensis Pb03]|nr:hypothetical protein PABG_11300 [Paracoccidioides brasiliensis Pb03]
MRPIIERVGQPERDKEKYRAFVGGSIAARIKKIVAARFGILHDLAWYHPAARNQQEGPVDSQNNKVENR